MLNIVYLDFTTSKWFNMMKKIILFIVLFLPFFSWAQADIECHIIDSLIIKADTYIGKDILEADYYISKNTLIKTNLSKSYYYQNISFGRIKTVCILNPLQIVIFYTDFNAIVLLDNQLNEIQIINGNLFDIPINISVFGLAAQNKLWLFDIFTQKFSLYDFKTNTNNTISTVINSVIKDYYSNYNYFYWIDNENHFYSISIFGAIQTLGTIPDYDFIQIIDASNVIFKKNNNLFLFHVKNQTLQKINLVEKSFTNHYYTNGILSIFTDTKIINYKIDLL
ncbi:hypothetical protein [uncultured Flavobacterium sp.]|uniref:hypothetical protein n=1 Tax=uncultured Flavobacterium sp. TaxID=165435 RepID=UPI0030CA2641